MLQNGRWYELLLFHHSQSQNEDKELMVVLILDIMKLFLFKLL